TRSYVDGLMKLWRPELDQRIAHERRPSTVGLEIEVVEIAGGERHAIGDLAVQVIEVDHKPVRHAVGFVFAPANGASGPRVALSGDTRRSPALVEAARGADILVHEVFIHREMP